MQKQCQDLSTISSNPTNIRTMIDGIPDSVVKRVFVKLLRSGANLRQAVSLAESVTQRDLKTNQSLKMSLYKKNRYGK